MLFEGFHGMACQKRAVFKYLSHAQLTVDTPHTFVRLGRPRSDLGIELSQKEGGLCLAWSESLFMPLITC